MTVDLVDHAFERASAPLVYIHRTGQDPAYCALIKVEHLRALIDLIPQGRLADIEALVMNHGHIEGDDPWPN